MCCLQRNLPFKINVVSEFMNHLVRGLQTIKTLSKPMESFTCMYQDICKKYDTRTSSHNFYCLWVTCIHLNVYLYLISMKFQFEYFDSEHVLELVDFFLQQVYKHDINLISMWWLVYIWHLKRFSLFLIIHYKRYIMSLARSNNFIQTCTLRKPYLMY